MGLTKVTTTLKSLADPQKSYEALFLVDTGATDCVAPAGELEKLRIRPSGKTAYELVDGSVREYPHHVGPDLRQLLLEERDHVAWAEAGHAAVDDLDPFKTGCK